MLKKLPLDLRFAMVIVIVGLNIVVCCTLVYLLTFLKLIIPFGGIRLIVSKWLAALGEFWESVNSWAWLNFYHVEWDIQVEGNLDPKTTYCVVVNHQSWVDIIALQLVLNRKIPFLRFFIKKDLIWVPFMGLAWWALDFPFMQRYSAAYLQKNPHKRGKDIETARKSCEKFRQLPTSILIFAEGTRFTEAKHKKTGSPYKNLLIPKSGGFYTVLDAMGDQIKEIVDVTIVYHTDKITVMDLLRDRIPKISFLVKTIPMPEQFHKNPKYPEVKKWMVEYWKSKDTLISKTR